MDESPRALELSGTVNLFGYPPAGATIRVLPRSRSWRGLRASAYLGGSLVLAPILGVVPPHAPWVLGVLGFGGFFGMRKWREKYTLVSFRGLCPSCGGALRIRQGTPLRSDISVPCDSCHHDSRLTVAIPPDGAFPNAAQGSAPDAIDGGGGEAE